MAAEYLPHPQARGQVDLGLSKRLHIQQPKRPHISTGNDKSSDMLSASDNPQGFRSLDARPLPYEVPPIGVHQNDTVKQKTVSVQSHHPSPPASPSPTTAYPGPALDSNLQLPSTPSYAKKGKSANISRPNVNINITYSTNYNLNVGGGRFDSFLSSPVKKSFVGSTLTRLQRLATPSINRDTIKFCLFCSLWYSSSALTNNTGKQILNHFKYPVTLTYIQFGFVSGLCWLMSRMGAVGAIKRPNRGVISQVLPLAIFQIAGHIFSSMAISRVPVSFAHTIKALSPLFTVFLYRVIYQVFYGPKVYLSLLPLTLGVMLVCMSELTFNMVGFLCALISTLIFVVQNIFSKKIFTENSGGGSNKLDKISLLFYSSGLAFLLMGPLWLSSDGWGFLFGPSSDRKVASWMSHRIPMLFLLNGTTHFAQNVIAFHLLSLVSPVTYSVASLIKRIFVITASIIWFAQPVDARQGAGILLTFFGLWVYQGAKREVGKGEEKLVKVREVLPLSRNGKSSI
ncbi:tpt phosphate/phosphoenolpyruvate translocator [Spizellomyces punctatus DAOM BR117]|uniref:Tpt phosphate/phosphoenolpyruvate translocator n=1 Tax=Spizellomyces punctatus (strain DAOM BR117) TaxID=645134 RepID=A0A0L0HDZ1_SPIPD|nr:tpt phosphate/phosphoenolpyruvate translocator [Spizellomyces punctatus DAOM BR117]KNC99327.1 tpt phosphate/phosphoenolpyruvate translocator [Spizellomyces punctatus DAOM BR117]|eukprot:XP_016607367.1 tpt phosphate/phosphoenolpyruvate translocator [Spizellomyces punctatus DAOM BR117]